MMRLRRVGTRRLHFVKEANASKRKALAVIATLPITHLVVEVTPQRGGPPPRARGLVALAEWASSAGATAIVLERDPTEVERDRRALFAGLSRTTSRTALGYRHADPEREPLLWIPDAVAWSWTRGGEWRRAVRGLGVSVMRL